MAIYNINDLGNTLRNVGENPAHLGSERMRLVDALRKYLEDLDAKD